MAAPTTALANTFRKELLTGTHNFGSNTFKLALYKAAASVAGTHNATETNYTGMSTDELSTGGGYTATGFSLTGVAPANTGAQAYTSFTAPASWTSATFVTSGGLLYNSTAGGNAVANLSWGGDQSVTAGTFTVNWPTNGAGTSIIQVN